MTKAIDEWTKTKLNLMASDVARHIEHISDENLGTMIEIALQEQDMRNVRGQEGGE